jgi:hypothetical protein
VVANRTVHAGDPESGLQAENLQHPASEPARAQQYESRTGGTLSRGKRIDATDEKNVTASRSTSTVQAGSLRA